MLDKASHYTRNIAAVYRACRNKPVWLRDFI